MYGDFHFSNKDRGKLPKKIEDAEFEKFEDAGIAGRFNLNPKTIGKSIENWPGNYFQIQQEGKWVPYELKERDIERRKTTCEILFDRFKRKSFLHRIVTGDEKWIYFDNPKRKKSWVDPGQPSTSQPVCNIHGKKALLCNWWDQKGAVYYELLKPGETVTGDR